MAAAISTAYVHGFNWDLEKPCPICASKAQMLVTAGTDENGEKYGGYRPECTFCHYTMRTVDFVRFDKSGDVVWLNPMARELAEAYWNAKGDYVVPSPPAGN